MDTITQITNAASKAIWGESQAESQAHEEPVSGKMGNVSAGEPYDAGNIEPNEAALSTTEKRETEEGDVGTAAYTTSTPVHAPDEPAATTRTTGMTVPEPMPKPEPEAATKPRFVPEEPAATTRTTGSTEPEPMLKPEPEAATMPRFADEASQPTMATTTDTANTASPAGPAKDAPSATNMRDDSTKAQSDTHQPGPSSSLDESSSRTDTAADTAAKDEPTFTSGGSISEDKAEVKDKKDDIKKAAEEDPSVNLEGPGPRPLEEIAREHGGDAGQGQGQGAGPGLIGGGDGAEAGAEEGPAGATAGHQRKDSAKSLGGEGGTGEEYIKTSGLAADGGDFDASKAGAGREADRLREEKGIHPGDPHPHGTGGTTGHGADSGPKEKVGLKDKIKAKLHKSTHSS